MARESIRITSGITPACLLPLFTFVATSVSFGQTEPADRVLSTEVLRAPPEMAMRVETAAGVFAVFDATGPDADPAHPTPYVAFWLDFATDEIFFFDALLYEANDVGWAIRLLERDIIDRPVVSAWAAREHLADWLFPARRGKARQPMNGAWLELDPELLSLLVGFDVPGPPYLMPPEGSGGFTAIRIADTPCGLKACITCNQLCCPRCDGECCSDTVCCALPEECCGEECCLSEDCCNGVCCDGECCGLVCCPPETPQCCDEAGGHCCPANVECCGANDELCCDPGAPCCGLGCCPPETPQCCDEAGELCCPTELECCITECCPEGWGCCDGVCCPDPCCEISGECCQDDGSVCTEDMCSGGVCVHLPTNDGFLCESDGTVCTSDFCSGGVCMHLPWNDGAVCEEDASICTDDICAGGVCTHPPANGGAECQDDLNICTNDICSGGSCVHLPTNNGLPCPDDGNICTNDICSNGSCIHPPANDGMPCPDDGNTCTDDVCFQTFCFHPPANEGAVCDDDGNICTDDRCAGGLCTHPPGSNGAPCSDDGNVCTNDLCSQGVCIHPPASEGAACPDDGNICTDDACSGGSCTHPNNTLPCDDGDPRTTNDVCSGGSCGGTSTGCANNMDCDDQELCTEDECVNEICVHSGISGLPCDDADPCTENDACTSSGACAGTEIDCSDGDLCTDDTCVGGICTNTPIDCDAGDVTCDGSGLPNTGETEIFGQLQSSITLCVGEANASSIPVQYSIVTHDTGRGRSLHGKLRLSLVGGDAAIVDILHGNEPYTLDSPIPVTVLGHFGCAVHDWHIGTTWFQLIPLNPGEVTFKAQLDPDPECCEGNGPPTVEAEVSVTVNATSVATLTLTPSSISATTSWLGMPVGLNESVITVTWDPPECVGTLEIVEIDGTGGYVPPTNGTLDQVSDTEWRYTAFDEPQPELCSNDVKVWIGVFQGQTELTRKRVTVWPVHMWWANVQQDLQMDYDYIRWKYGTILATTGGAFNGPPTFSESPQVSCGDKTGYACTTCIPLFGCSVVFGTNTFTGTANKAASIIGHELIHTVAGPFAGECPAYQWESDHRFQTAIYQCDTDYDNDVNQYLFINQCP